MSLFDFFRRHRSADQARERLQILVAHDRAGRERPDYLGLLQKDLLAVVAKYVEVDDEKVSVEVEDEAGVSMLAVTIELPVRRIERRRLQIAVG